MITTESVEKAVAEMMAAKGKVYPSHVNRVSSLDYACERRLVYQRTAWSQASPRSPQFQGILETGTELEPLIERNLSKIAELHNPPFRMVGQQMPTNDKFLADLKISGSVDGFLQFRIGSSWITVAVYDIKTTNPVIFGFIDGYESLDRYPWTRAYRGQLMLYALAHNLEHCCLIFVNKSNLYDIKIVEFAVDMEYCERLLQKAERINEAVDNGTLPAGIDDPKECPRCPFYSYCAPPLDTGGNLKILDDGELEAVLDRMRELDPAVAEYKQLEAQRDGMLRKGQDVAAGPWFVRWKQTRGGQWRKSIVRMED